MPHAMRMLTLGSLKTLTSKFMNGLELKDLFASEEIRLKWAFAKRDLDMFLIPDGTGGVNPGDRKALFYLISNCRPGSVLEIGTHIGASTLHIASALSMNRASDGGMNGTVVSVDIADVNDPVSQPWLKYGTKLSPLDILTKMNLKNVVTFVRNDSIRYLSRCDRKFDFIFLDGDHAAKTVYQEISMALALLNKGGTILLHDYFPDQKALWSDGSVVRGPFVAVQRCREEGRKIVALPLGELPWQTKLNSNVTSLALLVRVE